MEVHLNILIFCVYVVYARHCHFKMTTFVQQCSMFCLIKFVMNENGRDCVGNDNKIYNLQLAYLVSIKYKAPIVYIVYCTEIDVECRKPILSYFYNNVTKIWWKNRQTNIKAKYQFHNIAKKFQIIFYAYQSSIICAYFKHSTIFIK